VIAAALALVAFLPAPAQAQMSSSLVVHLPGPETPLVEGASLSLAGQVTLIADLTGYANLNGIPVTYTVVDKPAWAIVTLSPANDIFPVPYGLPMGTSYVVTRPIVVSVTVDPAAAPAQDTTDDIVIAATTAPSAPLATSATGHGSFLVQYDAPDEEPCAEHAGMTHEQMAQMAVDAADAYNAQQRDEASDDVTVQNTAATRVSTPWVAVGGFALVGAAVGLVLRRRIV